ncbi:hypothetical protein B0H11DRAFT_2229288 [Mycena galericulata]|nr:hypothetical protein B0H11DRAFT_2264189 [Mycena galericulata]KAJ7490389.1 hypothetical protein B0H11DRAFT_2229288 [Mycena galericulata]
MPPPILPRYSHLLMLSFPISTFLLIFSDRRYDDNTPSLLSLSAMRPPVTTLIAQAPEQDNI